MENFWQGKRVFITHPRSYLGSWLCRELLKFKAEVSAYSEPEESISTNLFDLEGLSLKVRLTEGRLEDRETLKAALEYSQADVLLHLSPLRSLKGDLESPVDLMGQEVLGTTQLMDLLRETASVRAAVVMSSDKVYAPTQELCEESSPVAASDLSTTAKLCAEWVALGFRHRFFSPAKYNKHKIALATVRACAPYGPGEKDSLLSQALSALDSGKGFPLKNPQSLRPWLHVQDLAEGVLLLAQALVEKGPKLQPTYNLFSENLQSVQEVVSTLYGLAGVSWPGQPSEGSELKGVSVHRQLSIEAAARDLSWKPRLSLEEGLRSVLSGEKDRRPAN